MSELGKGDSTFTDPHCKRSILLVEDNQDDERMALRVIKNAIPGSDVMVARDGFEALQQLVPTQIRASASPFNLPDLVILDLKLPKISGLEVLRSLRASTDSQYVPVVVFSSSDEATDIASCYESGANCYVRKHVSYDRYKESLVLLLRFWLTEVSLPKL